MLSKKNKIRVYYEDTDAGGIVYYANYFKFTERCRTEFLRDHGIEQIDIFRKYDIKFVVHKVFMEYIASSFLDDLLIIETSIDKIRNVSINFSQNIYKKMDDNNIINIAKSKCSVVSVNSFSKVVSIPNEIIKKISEDL